MIGTLSVFGLLSALAVLACGEAASASFTLLAHEREHVQVTGYRGLAEISLFTGSLNAGVKQVVDTPYQGLALLVFEQGQQYPFIVGKQPVILNIQVPSTPPAFLDSDENTFFYALLTGAEAENARFAFPLLMVEAKQLLESSYSLRTVSELAAMKEKFHGFIRSHYQDLQHSDMLRRLIRQYFMMHEYVDYHTQGAPAEDISLRYREAVMDGVGNWLEILKPHIPPHEILNYCVSLYYNRSMVTLASTIVEAFQQHAYCPGVEKNRWNFPPELALAGVDGSKRQLKELKTGKTIAFVSDECPVSMVETVVRARRSALQPDTVVLVVPLQQLSSRHLALRKMVHGGNMLFVDDEKWRKEHVPAQLKLPGFVQIERDEVGLSELSSILQ